MSKPLLVVYNPRSRLGLRTAERLRARADEQPPPPLAPAAGVARGAIEWVTLDELGRRSSVPGGEGEARARSDLPDRMVVVGGDGTVNAVATWLDRLRASVPLALVPAGTGNNLARGLGVPLETDAAWRLAQEGETTRRIDAIAYRVDDEPRERLLIQTGALGFPAEVAGEYDRLRQRPLLRALFRPLGPLAYRLLALQGIARQKRRDRRHEPPLEVVCELPGETLREPTLAVFLGNERSLGGNFIPCPRAEPGDGLLDLCLVRAGTQVSYLRLFAAIGRGRHLGAEEIVYRQTAGPLRITLSAPRGLLADGDIWTTGARFDLRVLPGRIEVVTPTPTASRASLRSEPSRPSGSAAPRP